LAGNLDDLGEVEADNVVVGPDANDVIVVQTPVAVER
jgi:hypothetical protein